MLRLACSRTDGEVQGLCHPFHMPTATAVTAVEKDGEREGGGWILVGYLFGRRDEREVDYQ